VIESRVGHPRTRDGQVRESNLPLQGSIPASVRWEFSIQRVEIAWRRGDRGRKSAIRFPSHNRVPVSVPLIAASGGDAGGHLWFWKPDQANELFKLVLPNTARDMDLHPDGLRIATAHHDGKVRVSAMGAT
jgi:hypothetical protein